MGYGVPIIYDSSNQLLDPQWISQNGIVSNVVTAIQNLYQQPGKTHKVAMMLFSLAFVSYVQGGTYYGIYQNRCGTGSITSSSDCDSYRDVGLFAFSLSAKLIAAIPATYAVGAIYKRVVG